MRAVVPVLMLLALGGAVTQAADPAALLTEGKLHADLGERDAAAQAFAAVAEDGGAPAALRSEALVRLGLVRRDAGDTKGAARAFARAWKDYREDSETVRALVRASGGATPGRERWDEIWRRVVVKVDGAVTDRPVLAVEWPDVPAPMPRYGGQPISLDLQDGELNSVFRTFADVTQLNVVVHPGVAGTLTFQAKGMPWDEALDRILPPNGFAWSHVGPVLEIARPIALRTSHRFAGAAIDVDYKEVELQEALRLLVERGGHELRVDAPISGTLTLLLEGVPWDQALDVIARCNGLAWKQEGSVVRVWR